MEQIYRGMANLVNRKGNVPTFVTVLSDVGYCSLVAPTLSVIRPLLRALDVSVRCFLANISPFSILIGR